MRAQLMLEFYINLMGEGDVQATEVPQKSCARMSCVMRVINVISALILIGFGVAGMVVMILNSLTSAKFFLLFSPIFMILVGVLFMAAEFEVECIMRHFVFLKSYFGRGVFNLFMASSVFYYFTCGNDNTVVAWIAAALIFFLGAFYIIIGTCLSGVFEKPPKPSKEELIT